MGNNWTVQNGENFVYGVEQNPDYNSNSSYFTYNNPDILGVNIRKGVRSGNYVRDIEIIPNGFSQLEGIGWKNIFSIY